ncbi:MAG: 30S ribosomal protein S6 [Myxococcales bacterium]|nr:30S ribosomal protein S6 [Myxococcales bacterium]MCB9519978.1 30S ribosomal protein S6 [Myxococcales bacterium]MCB9533111.1 30S ribosomal protein S6 [Myxococcales bacterium]
MPANRQYETTLILNPSLDEAERGKIRDRVVGIITEQFGGEILKTDDWGRRQLAYPIAKEGQGYYLYWRYLAPGECIAELERILRILDAVMKFLTVRLEDDDHNLETATPDQSLLVNKADDNDDDDSDD